MIKTNLKDVKKLFYGSAECEKAYLGDKCVFLKPFEPDWVEIGGIKWATCNVGATKPEEYGLYFAWGETQGYTASQVGTGSGKRAFKWEDYKYSNGSSSPTASSITKYNSSDGLTTLELSDDAAYVAYGGNWRMPTSNETQILGNSVTTTWTTNYKKTGIAGLICTDKTNSSKVLFFPAAGFASSGKMYDIGTQSYFWISSLYNDVKTNGQRMGFSSDTIRWASNYQRRNGYTVRAILDE